MDRFSFLDCKALPIFWPFDFCGSALPQQNSVMSFFFKLEGLNLLKLLECNHATQYAMHNYPS